MRAASGPETTSPARTCRTQPAGVGRHGTLEQARTVLRLRRVGLSLPEVTAAMAPTKSAARAVVRTKIAALEDEVVHRQRAITFLQHTVECRHRYLDDCPDCATFVRES